MKLPKGKENSTNYEGNAFSYRFTRTHVVRRKSFASNSSGRNGEFQVLTNHAPIISSLVAGKISYTSGAETQSLQIAGGFADINNNQISVCVEL